MISVFAPETCLSRFSSDLQESKVNVEGPLVVVEPLDDDLVRVGVGLCLLIADVAEVNAASSEQRQQQEIIRFKHS
jgi:hypothetical protein